MYIRKKTSLVCGVIVLSVALLCGLFCVFVRSSRTGTLESAYRLKVSDRLGVAMRRVYAFAQNAVKDADAIPVEMFDEITDSVEAQNRIPFFRNGFVDVAFRLRREKGENLYGGISGIVSDGFGAFIRARERIAAIRKIYAFADEKLPAREAWEKSFSLACENLQASEDYESARERGISPKNIPPEAMFPPADGNVSDIRKLPRGGRWVVFSRAGKTQGEESFSGGFKFENFCEEIFLTREIRAPDEAKCVQGFILNRERLSEKLKREISDLLPAATVEFPPEKNSDTTDCFGLLLRISPGDLPEKAECDAEISALSAFLFLSWITLSVAGAGMVFFFRNKMEIEKQRRVFVAAISHDLKTPVGELETTAENFSRKIRDEAELSREFFKVLSRIKNLSELLENTLLFSRIEKFGTKNILSLRSVPAESALAPVFERVAERLERSGCDFETKISSAAQHARVRVSTTALERILSNLADNAAKYASDVPDPVFSISADAGENCLIVRAEDNGNGFSAEAKKNIFRAFRHAGDKANPFGLGIGLALSKKLAQMMDGNLILEKSDSAGTRFVLILKTESAAR